MLGLLLVAGCGLASGDEAAHPADLDGDGQVSPDEFVEFAAKQEAEAVAGDSLDANGDGQVTTEEFVAFAEKQAEQEGDMGPRAMTAENFHENTKGTKSAFVMFSMAGCVHCANMEEAWRQLATTVHTNHPGTVRIGTVDCDDQREFCEMFQIQGFPTLLLMKDPEVSASRGNQHPLLHVPRNFDQACTDPAVARFVTSRLCLLVVGPGVCRCTRTPHQSSSRVSAAMRACSSSSRTRASCPLRHNPCQRRLQGRGEG